MEEAIRSYLNSALSTLLIVLYLGFQGSWSLRDPRSMGVAGAALGSQHVEHLTDLPIKKI